MLNFVNAFFISLKAHRGQRDKAGRLYIFHIIYVMFNTKGIKGKIVALLHDVVEDSEITIDFLKSYFDEEIVKAVDVITKKPNQSYFDYLKVVKNNKLARQVKISDLKHNSNLNRLNYITNKDIKRNMKYKRALDFLGR
ncbi:MULTISPECIES: GTP pyrophosphokinase [unclassified Gemella]|uniref:GTP pyrophosphokinase n=1 Tax=unclassified Gemella TaxID=2624949 RepID=UPI001C03FCAC|nr:MULTISPECIES: GTP pyrophosphokinase [unclassified Gemella]MBU0279350.1 GTP pyrophosphokinase [Gemella sp. zg-1178]QWQ39303.1 GTP pyrophosphokinase [Gemella sp. zg-570]